MWITVKVITIPKRKRLKVHTWLTQRLLHLQLAATFLTIGKSSRKVMLLLLANAMTAQEL